MMAVIKDVTNEVIGGCIVRCGDQRKWGSALDV
jgi:hypothetical protein